MRWDDFEEVIQIELRFPVEFKLQIFTCVLTLGFNFRNASVCHRRRCRLYRWGRIIFTSYFKHFTVCEHKGEKLFLFVLLCGNVNRTFTLTEISPLTYITKEWVYIREAKGSTVCIPLPRSAVLVLRCNVPKDCCSYKKTENSFIHLLPPFPKGLSKLHNTVPSEVFHMLNGARLYPTS